MLGTDETARHRRLWVHRIEFRTLLARAPPKDEIVNLDLLTYAGTLQYSPTSNSRVAIGTRSSAGYRRRGAGAVRLTSQRPEIIVNLAAESHNTGPSWILRFHAHERCRHADAAGGRAAGRSHAIPSRLDL